MILAAIGLLVMGASEPRAVSLTEALELAAKNNPSIDAARHRLEATREDQRAVQGGYLPSMGALAELVGSTTNNSTATLLSNPAVNLPRIGATRVSDQPSALPAASTVVAIGIRQLVYDFGRLDTQEQATKASTQVETERLATALLELRLAVRLAYHEVLTAMAVLQASSQALVRAQANRDFAKTAVEAQVRPPIERTRAEADLARAEVGKLRAQSALRSARIRLAAVVATGEPALDAVPLTDETTALPDEAALVQAALTFDPLVKAAQALVNAKRLEAQAVGLATRPQLFADAALSLRGGGAEPSSGTLPAGAGFLPNTPNYAAGLVLSWPFLDFSTGHREAAATERVAGLERDLASLKLAIAARASQALENANLADHALEALTRAAEAAAANAAQADARFRAGLGTSTELADAEALRTGADIALAVGRFDALDARAVLTRLTAEESTP